MFINDHDMNDELRRLYSFMILGYLKTALDVCYNHYFTGYPLNVEQKVDIFERFGGVFQSFIIMSVQNYVRSRNYRPNYVR